MRQVGMRYRVVSQTFGVLVLSYVLMTIWWFLVGGELGEPEDDEKDSSVGASGGGGEGVCERDGSGGEKESMVGLTREKRLEQWKVTEAWR